MSLLWKLRWLLLLIIFQRFNVQYVRATWPLFDSPTIQLLGLFPDEINSTGSIEFGVHSRAMFKASIVLAQQYNIRFDRQFIGWQVAQTNGEPINTLSSTCQAISTYNIVGIVGPALSRETPIIAGLGKTVGIPVISYSATESDLSDRNAYPAFHRTVPSDYAAALAIVKLFGRYNWTSCIIIYQNDAYGTGGAKAITDAFMNNDLLIADTLIFDVATLRMRDNLTNILTSSSTRIVVLWVGSAYSSLVVQNALDSDVLGPHFTWILSSSISLNSFNQTFHQKLIGLFTIVPIIVNDVHSPTNTTLLKAAYDIWKQYEPETFPGLEKVHYFALFTFDATWLLIQSLHEFCSKTSSSPCLSFLNYSSFCFDRRLLNSKSFFDTIDNMKFLGVSGLIQFNNNVTDRINGSYYLARNSQRSSDGLNFVPVLSYSDYYGWKEYSETNVIIWPNNSLTPPTGIAKLDGVKLRIGIIQSIPFTMIQTVKDEFGENTIEYTGYVPDLIDILQDKMKFIPDIRLIPTNETYASLVQAIEDNIYDIIIGDVTITATRRQKVGFSNSIFANSLRIVVRKSPDVHIDLFSFMKPFSRNLWILTFSSIIFASILICLIERTENEALNDQSIISLCGMSVWYCFGHLIGYGVEFYVRTAAGRLLTTGLYILSIVLVASYTANLASELTILKSKDIISGIDDIKNGKIPHHRIGISIGSVSEEYYLREISGGNRDYYPLRSRQELFDGLLNNSIDVSFLDMDVGEYAINNIYCNLTLTGEGFNKGEFGIVTPKKWLYAQDLDVNILSLREARILDNLKTKWFQLKTCSSSSDTSTAIGIESLSGLFVIFVTICILSLLSFAWRECYKKLSTWINRWSQCRQVPLKYINDTEDKSLPQM